MELNELLFVLAGIAYIIGTLLLMIRVIHNKNSIKDFDFYGSSLTMIGVFFTTSAQILSLYLFAAVLQVPILIFWIYVSIYSFKNRRSKCK